MLSGLSSRTSLINGGGATRVAARSSGRRMTMAAVPAPSGANVAQHKRRTIYNAASSARQAQGSGAPVRSARTSGVRQSSMYGTSRGGVRVDPRPISDRSYMVTEAETLVRFLAEHDYDRAISRENLQYPSKNDFLHILEFLLRLMDANYKLGQKPDEEVPLLFSNIRYPFRISKSHMQAVGSPHTWPHLLAALNWLVNLLSYDEDMQRSSAASEPQQNGEHMFFVYISKAYDEFMRGEDNCDEDLFRSLEERNDAIKEASERLLQENDGMSSEIQRNRTDGSPLEQLLEEKEILLKDRENFKKYVHDFAERKNNWQERMEKQTAQLEKEEVELEHMRQLEPQLEQCIRAQVVSVSDLERMMKEKANLEELLSGYQLQREVVDARIWEQDMQRMKTVESLEQLARSYNDAAARLRMVPWNAKNAGGRDLEIVINTNSITTTLTTTATVRSYEEGITNLDLKGTVRPAVLQLKELLSMKLSTARSEALKTEALLNAKLEMLQETRDSVAPLEGQVHRIESLLQSLKESAASKMKRTGAEADVVQEELKHMRDEGAAEFINARSREIEAQERRNDLEAACTAQRNAAIQRLTEVLQKVSAHRRQLNASMLRLQDSYADTRRDVKVS